MSTHAAVAITAKGVIDTIEVSSEEPLDDEVMLKVECTAVIPPEVYMVDKGMFIESYPYILGFTSAGTVMKVGSYVKDIKPNDRVSSQVQ
jgi:Zn-dependent alcohol dehydrogenase